MLIRFFFLLRKGGLKVSITEFLTLLEALKAGLADYSIDEFYYLSRACLVKDESNFDKFDRAFSEHFKGIQAIFGEDIADIPEDWLRKQLELYLSDEEKEKIESLGGWDALMETLKKRLEEQQERHEGGSKWIGTGGTSPFGAYGYNPEGIRIGQNESRNRRAVKVWDKREFRNLDDSLELGTRNLKVALRRLAAFCPRGCCRRTGSCPTRSIPRPGTRAYLDIKMVPERHNAVKVLLFLDIGGSMDDHVRVCEELVLRCPKNEFKHLEYFYFHNCVYESVWKDNHRRHSGPDADHGRAAQVRARITSSSSWATPQ